MEQCGEVMDQNAMTEPIRLLLIFINESDLWRDEPLYEVIVRRMRELGISGATAQKGLAGFGAHLVVSGRPFFTDYNPPVTITIVDTESRLRAVFPEIRSLVREGLVVMLPAELVHVSVRPTSPDGGPA